MLQSGEPVEKFNQLLQRLEGLVERLEKSSGGESDRRVHLYEQTLREAVEVLEKTKHAFHSKQLKHLREQLMIVLQGSK
jgi:hypothetical protein